MSWLRFVLLATAAYSTALSSGYSAADSAKLHEQLTLATEDEDTLSRIEILRRILDATPGDTASHRLLVELWLKAEDYDMAEATLSQWPQAPADLQALTRAEVLRLRDQDTPGAIRVLQDYLKTSPKDAVALETLVQCLSLTDDRPALLEALNALIDIQRNETNLIRRANVKLKLSDYAGALADAKAAQALKPDADIVKNNISRFERLEEAMKALPPLDKAIAADPKDFFKLLDRTWWRRYGEMLEPALADAEAAAALQPDSVMAKIAAARASYLLDKVKADDVRRDTLIDPTNPHALETSEAIAVCDLALATNPKDVAQLSSRARALVEADQYALARRDAEAAMAIDPKAGPAAIAALQAAVLMGDDSGATTILRQIEAMKPKKAALASALAVLAQVYFDKANLAMALDFATRSIALQESEAAYRVKAATLQRQGKSKEADEAFAKAKTLKKKEKQP